MLGHRNDKKKASIAKRIFHFFPHKKHNTQPRQAATVNDSNDLNEMILTDAEMAICANFASAGILKLTTGLDRYCNALPDHMQEQTLAKLLNELHIIFTLKPRTLYDSDSQYMDENIFTELHLHADKNTAGDLNIDFIDIERKLCTNGEYGSVEETTDRIHLSAHLLKKLRAWQQKLQANIIQQSRLREPATEDFSTSSAESKAFVRIYHFINDVSRSAPTPPALNYRQ